MNFSKVILEEFVEISIITVIIIIFRSFFFVPNFFNSGFQQKVRMAALG